MKANKIMLSRIDQRNNCKCQYYESKVLGKLIIISTCKFHRMNTIKDEQETTNFINIKRGDEQLSKTPILQKIADQMVHLSKVPIINLSKTQIID